MDSNTSSAIIAAIMGVLSSVLTTYVKNFNESKKEKIAELKLINHEHFNHLRLELLGSGLTSAINLTYFFLLRYE